MGDIWGGAFFLAFVTTQYDVDELAKSWPEGGRRRCGVVCLSKTHLQEVQERKPGSASRVVDLGGGRMAATHIALLRGINVGTAKRVAMEDLRAVMNGLGFGDVRTLLNSGNVVFSARGGGDPSRRIGVEIEKRLGVKSRVTVLTAAELDVAVRGNSLLKVATHPSRLLVGVLASRDDRVRLEELARQRWPGERLALGERVCYLWCPDGVAKSRVMAEVEKALGDGVTSRNWGTIQKLHGLVQPQ